MPRELPPPTTVTPDDLWVLVQGSPRKPDHVPPIDGATDDIWMVLPSRTNARNEARRQSAMYGLKMRAMPLTDFLARRYAP